MSEQRSQIAESSEVRRIGRYVCFTLNNYTNSETERILSDKIKEIRYIKVGKEIGPQSSTPHLQGWCQLYQATTMIKVKKILMGDKNWKRIHCEFCKGNIDQNERYTSKDFNWEVRGIRAKQGTRQDLTDVKDAVLCGDWESVLFKHGESYIKYSSGLEKYRNAVADALYAKSRPNYKARRIIFRWGESGVGKTRSVYEEAEKLGGGVYRVPRSNGGKLWYTGMEVTDKVCLFDEFDGEKTLTYEQFKEVTDGYKVKVPIHCGLIWFYPETIIFTCNVDPSCFYAMERNADKRRGGKDPFERRVSEITEIRSDSTP